MLGHKLWQISSEGFDTFATIRQDHPDLVKYGRFDLARLRTGVIAQNIETVRQVVEELSPDVIVNCIGVVKQLPSATDPVLTIQVNSLFPHQVAQLSKDYGARLIHLSTDCVFSGRKGMYAENDIPDPTDLYGRSKLLGEVTQQGCLTVRTSMIGREVTKKVGLLEWFLSKDGQRIDGFVNVIFSGLSTIALARIILRLCADSKNLSGLYHVSSDPINKYELLARLRDKLSLSTDIKATKHPHSDRSLDSSKFWLETGLPKPVWEDMLDELATDVAQYQSLGSVRRSQEKMNA